MTEDQVTPFPGVMKRSDSNVYQFGLRVPQDLLRHFPGPWAFRRSLGTADLREANEKAKALQAEWAQRFAALRTDKPQPVDLTALRARLLAYAENVYLPAADRQSAGLTPATRAQEASIAEATRMEVLDGLARGYVPASVEEWLSTVLRHERSPLTEAETLPFLAMLLELRQEGLTDLTRTFPLRVQRLAERRALLGARSSTPSQAPAVEGSREGSGAPALDRSGRRMAAALEAWQGLAVRVPKTAAVFRRHLDQFMEMTGDPPLSAIDRAMANKFAADLQRWAVAEKKTKQTADNVLTSIKALASVAVQEGWMPANPFAGLAVKAGGREAEKREPWSPEELPVLFDAPLFNAYQVPAPDSALSRKAGLDAAYWMPLLCLFTGARPGEVCQLWTDDLSESPGTRGTGVLTVEFRKNSERGQSLKNPSSWRALPVHSELLRLGLRDYWQAVQAAHGDTPGPLFPAIPTKGANGPSGQFGQWFGAFKTAQGFGPSKTLHSFRHTLETELGLAGVTPTIVDAITGHEGEGVGRKQYGATIRRNAVRLQPEIERLLFPGLRLPRVFSAPVWTPNG